LLAGLATGDLLPEQWGAPSRPVDFFDAKGDLEAVLALTDSMSIRFIPAEHPALHPGQSARILRGAEVVGWIGVLHPELQRRLDFLAEPVLFEVRLQPLSEGRLPIFQPISKFPSIRRDLALVVDRLISSSQIVECIRAGGWRILQDISVFDVYTGDKIDSSQKSMALALILQDSSHTLTDVEVELAVGGILQSLKDELGATLRE
jgi:phenylalanyl-tRNA synthetase beta chain